MMRHLKQFKEKDRNGEKNHEGQEIGETELVKQKFLFLIIILVLL